MAPEAANFHENRRMAARTSLEARHGLSNMRKPHVNPPLAALTPLPAKTM
jgi:hypothetical protein